MQQGVSSLAISLYEKRSAVAIYLIYKGANIHITEKVQYFINNMAWYIICIIHSIDGMESFDKGE